MSLYTAMMNGSVTSDNVVEFYKTNNLLKYYIINGNLMGLFIHKIDKIKKYKNNVLMKIFHFHIKKRNSKYT